VGAQHPADIDVARELDQPPDARPVRGEVPDVEAAGVERVAGQEQAGAVIVERDVRRLVAGDRDHVHDSPAEVDGRGVARPG
jgi:hypothetical protein